MLAALDAEKATVKFDGDRSSVEVFGEIGLPVGVSFSELSPAAILVDFIMPNMNGRAVFYMDRTIRTKVRQQASAKKDNLTITEIGGITVQDFHGIPLRRNDALKTDEAQIT